jgi:hypothetical protein
VSSGFKRNDNAIKHNLSSLICSEAFVSSSIVLCCYEHNQPAEELKIFINIPLFMLAVLLGMLQVAFFLPFFILSMLMKLFINPIAASILSSYCSPSSQRPKTSREKILKKVEQ